MKTALITGITGQDGSYLAEFLLNKGYKVIGLKRRTSIINTSRIDHIFKNKRFALEYYDVTDPSAIVSLIYKYKPDEIYNLAAQSHVKVSFDNPIYTTNSNALGVLYILEAIRNFNKNIKFYQASTSELYGSNKSKLLNEKSTFMPASPYAVSKLYAFWITKNYREAYKIFCCNGILFNHESPRRGETFITSKVCKGAIDFINSGKVLEVGNIYASRDWGHAKDYVESMWKMLQYKKPDDYVISTNKSYTIKYLIEFVYKKLGVIIKWSGSGLKEIGIDKKSSKIAIKINKKYFRPTEVDHLRGDSSKAIKILKWKNKINFECLIDEMIEAEKKKLINR